MNYSRIIGSLLALAVLIHSSPALALAGGPTLSAQASQATVTTGSEFTATILIDTKTYSVTAAELNISFPSDKLQAVSITAGQFLPTVLVPGSTGSGVAQITVASGTTAKQGTGTLATITFRALSSGVAQVGFSNSTLVAATGQTGNVVDTMTPATITISGGAVASSTPMNTVAPSAAPGVACTAQYDPVCGVNGVTYSNRCVAEQQYGIAVARTGACTSQASQVSQASAVSTGPGESTALAIALSALIALLYAGYSTTATYRRHEAQEVVDHERKEPLDFK